MNSQKKLVDLIDLRIKSFLESRADEMEYISQDLEHILAYANSMLGSGKRFRGRFCFWGWKAIPTDDDSDPLAEKPSIDFDSDIIALAASLEVFHAAALVHDDIMDSSDTRRGLPAAHKAFEELHRGRSYSGDSEHFGISTSLLLGDLLLAWSDDLLSEAVANLDTTTASATRAQFSQMRQEVTLGQYLDIHEEAAWLTVEEKERLERALRVVTYKSAKYSMEAPLLIGASLAGANERGLAELSAFGLPLGIAFQLRDDVLGVFGDSEVTGKPSGDDLREGKRTVLIERAEAQMPQVARNVFDELLGNRSLSPQQIEMMQKTLEETGALNEVERMIKQYGEKAMEALEASTLTDVSKKELRRLAEAVTQRTS